MKIDSSTNSSYHRWVDAARVLGAFFVVMIHTEHLYLGQKTGLPFYYAVTRTAVPLFFMTSGFLLLSKIETLQDFFRKRAVKVLVPTLAWSVIFLLWKGEGIGKPFLSFVATYAIRIASRPSEDHLWFLYALIGLYLFTPILRPYLQKAEWRDQMYYLGIWFFFTSIVLFLSVFTRIEIGIYYQYVSGYVGYFLFGHFMGNFPVQKKHKNIALGVFITSLAITVLGMLYEIKSEYFEDYLSMNVVIMSWSLFTLLKDMPISDHLYQALAPLSRASFGIYLVHMIVIVELSHTAPFLYLTETGNQIYMEPILGAIAFSISFAIIYFLQKIPIIRSIVA